ncbi:MAG: VanW family protein [Saccharofermentans sp.]|nr:VanW family protein [Saccharofermentans sp.]
MKKTSQGNNSRKPAVRSAYTPTTTYRKSSSAPVRSSTTGKARKPIKKKKSGGKAAAIAIVAVVAVLAGGAAFILKTDMGQNLYKKVMNIEETYQLTNADGTVVELTEAQLREQLSVTTFPQGVVVDGTDVGGMTKEEASAALKAAAPSQPITTNISLELDGELIPLDLSSLQFASNLDEILDEAYSQFALKGDEDVNGLIANYNTRENLKKNPVQYNSAYTLSTEGISEIVHGQLDSMSSEAKDAEITGFDIDNLVFNYTESSKGYVIDIDGAVDSVKALLDSSVYEGVVTVSAEVTEPTLTSEIIQTEFGKVSSASSQTSANSNRNHNISITCEKISGMVLQPNETFSFNGFIGQRTPDKGYMLAGTIQDGQLKDDYGGGICQVTSMIFQSVVKANLFDMGAGYNSEGQERHEHMWPSSYAVAGTDAAVDWPAQDFKFTNTSGYPIALVLYWNPDNSYITCEIYGHLLPDGKTIGFEGSVIGRQSATTEYIADPNMPVGQRSSTRGAHDGVTATSYQIWYDASGNEVERIELPTSHYYAINAQVSVGVRNPDGSLATMAADGSISGGTPAETEPTDTNVTDPAATDTQTPVETQATQAPETQATQPPETQPAETQAPAPETPPEA